MSLEEFQLFYETTHLKLSSDIQAFDWFTTKRGDENISPIIFEVLGIFDFPIRANFDLCVPVALLQAKIVFFPFL